MPLPSGFSTPSQRYRLPYVACIAQRSSDQPRRWLQYYAPAGHSTSLYVRFYGVVCPPSACPTFINLSGTTRRVTLDEFHALHRTRSTPRRALLVPRSSNDMPKTPRVPRRLSILARLWFFPRRCLRPFVHPRPRPRWMPRGARRPTTLQSARFAAGVHALLTAAGGTSYHGSNRNTSRRYTHDAAVSLRHSPGTRRLPPPLPSVKLSIQAPAPSGQCLCCDYE